MDYSTTTDVIVLDFLRGNELSQLSLLQLFLQEHLTAITIIWWTIWISVIVFLVTYYIIFTLLKK